MPKRWITDLALTIILLLLMGYSLIGEAIHEWLGITMLALVILHHAWNWTWYKSFGTGRMSIYRAVQNLLTCLLLLFVFGSLLSGLILSRLPCAFWSFLLMALHLGLHWGGVMGTARRFAGLTGPSRVRTAVLQLTGVAIACYGLLAFSRSGFLDYLLLRTHFLFFPPDQTITGFLKNYLAILGLFIWIGHYGGNGLGRCFIRKKVPQ